MYADVLDALNARPSRFISSSGDIFVFQDFWGRIKTHDISKSTTNTKDAQSSQDYLVDHPAKFDPTLEIAVRDYLRKAI